MLEYKSYLKFPSNKNIRIWRYLDLPKFVSFLDKGLFFPNIKDFIDPYEGILPKTDLEKINQQFRDHEKKLDKNIHPTISSDQMAEIHITEFRKYLERIRKIVLINSWHMNEYESAAMWDLYSTRNAGIAIQSTYQRLVESLEDDPENRIELGTIEYRDYDMPRDDEQELNKIFFTKRLSFQHERELRAVIILPFTDIYSPGGEEHKEDYSTIKLSLNEELIKGKYVNVDLERIIENIFISPLSQPYFQEVVKSILNKYNISKNPVVSDLYTIK